MAQRWYLSSSSPAYSSSDSSSSSVKSSSDSSDSSLSKASSSSSLLPSSSLPSGSAAASRDKSATAGSRDSPSPSHCHRVDATEKAREQKQWNETPHLVRRYHPIHRHPRSSQGRSVLPAGRPSTSVRRRPRSTGPAAAKQRSVMRHTTRQHTTNTAKPGDCYGRGASPQRQCTRVLELRGGDTHTHARARARATHIDRVNPCLDVLKLFRRDRVDPHPRLCSAQGLLRFV